MEKIIKFCERYFYGIGTPTGYQRVIELKRLYGFIGKLSLLNPITNGPHHKHDTLVQKGT